MAFAKHKTYAVADDDLDLKADDDSVSTRGRRRMGENEIRLNAAVRAVGDRARAAHLDPTIRVRFDPSVIRKPPAKKRKGKR